MAPPGALTFLVQRHIANLIRRQICLGAMYPGASEASGGANQNVRWSPALRTPLRAVLFE
jgi:hypothetical protein